MFIAVPSRAKGSWRFLPQLPCLSHDADFLQMQYSTMLDHLQTKALTSDLYEEQDQGAYQGPEIPWHEAST